MDIREEIAKLALTDPRGVTAAAERYGVSRVTARMWRDRYCAEGRAGMADRSHAPGSCPHRTSAEVEELILEERRTFRWGSKKILARLREMHPELKLPPRSTVDAILSRNGLVERERPRRTKSETPFRHRYVAAEPGELTTIDHKGEFRLRNGRYCYPLTIVDSVSRYILACEALSSKRFQFAWPVVERVLREHGLPLAMQSDNGAPFGNPGGHVSRFSVELMKLGVRPVFGRPGKPQDNGRHERMHRDVKREATRPPAASISEQQKMFDEFVRRYNCDRPHEAIGMERPARAYRQSSRPFPRRRPKPNYPLHAEKRKVSPYGYIKWRNDGIFLGTSLAGEFVALDPAADARLTVLFFGFALGQINERDNTFI